MRENCKEEVDIVASRKRRVCIIGAGVSGIAAARVCLSRGYEVVIYEKSEKIGGIWSLYQYPGCSAQNTEQQYHLSSFDWDASGIACDRHPTSQQIVQYLEAAVRKYGMDIRLRHHVVSMKQQEAQETSTT